MSEDGNLSDEEFEMIQSILPSLPREVAEKVAGDVPEFHMVVTNMVTAMVEGDLARLMSTMLVMDRERMGQVLLTAIMRLAVYERPDA